MSQIRHDSQSVSRPSSPRETLTSGAANAANAASLETLTCREIHSLSDVELIELIRSVGSPGNDPTFSQRLEFQSRPVLERLAFLARECRRHQTTTRDTLCGSLEDTVVISD